MMYNFTFWKSWPILYQRLFWAFLLLTIIAVAFLWTSNLRSPEPVLAPEAFQRLEAQEIPVHRFQQGSTQVTITAENYLLFERVLGGELKPNLPASYLFLALLLGGTIILLSVLTTLPRFWFYMGIGLFVLMVVSFNLGALQLFGFTNLIPVVVVSLAYVFAGYYFQFLRPSALFLPRVITFLSITLIIGTVIAFFARVGHPIYLLSAHGLIAGAIFSVLFIFTVAHEIIASFILIITQARRPTKSLQHFLILSAIYMVNLGLIYADKKHIIEWSFFSLSLFVLVTLSGILGLWGFHQREPQYESIMKANPFGTYFYIAFAGIGFASMGYFLATANDPAVQIMQDAILYSHIGYGLIFFIYIIANFISPLGANLQVYKVLYKPTNMPYFTFRFAGLIATFAFFAYSNWKVSVNQVYAGYYNAMGDYHLSQDTLTAAEGFYQRSLFYATRNYHAHYAAAEFYASRYQYDKEKEELQNLANGRPLDLGYLNWSRNQELTDSWKAAAKVLNDGLKDFPDNGLLLNALGFAYSKMNNEDSAMLAVRAAMKSPLSKSAAQVNLMGLLARFTLDHPVDSMANVLNFENPGVKSNALALASQQGKSLSLNADPGSDTVLTSYSATALNNYLLNHLDQVDTALVSKTIWLSRKPINENFKDFLLVAASHAYYADGQTKKAIKLIHEIAFMSKVASVYNVLGLWCLEQGDAENAILFFNEALSKEYHPAYYNRALALSEAGDPLAAVLAWDSLRRSGEVPIRIQATRKIAVLSVSPQEALSLRDEEKFEFTRNRFSIGEQKEFENFLISISDQELRARAIIDRAKKLEEADEIEMVLQTISLIKGLQLPNKNLNDEIVHLRLRCIARQKNWTLLQQQLASGISFDGIYRQEKMYFDALLNEQAGNTAGAAKQFEWLGRVNPFFEDAVIASSTFLSKINPDDKLKSYSVLVDALDTNPNSIKLLKAVAIASVHLGFELPSRTSVDRLQVLMDPAALLRFIKENPGIFEVAPD